jgi:hypothetical protein
MTDNGKLLKTSDLDLKRLDAALKYPGVWKHVIEEWNSDLTGNSAWLTYSANYLLQTAGVRWAIDPFSMSTRVTGIPVPDFAHDLQKLELVVLTHAHNDHLDLNLIRAIASLPIQWVIPEDMVDLVLAKTALNKEQIIIPKPGGVINFQNLSLTPFASLHFHAHGGVMETGYLANFDQKTWLFPGDIRDFDAARLPSFGRVNGVFAHLWLGKACALLPEPPFLNDFCTFFTRFSPKRIVVTHLNEFGRDETELWEEAHFDRVKQRFAKVAPVVKVEMAVMGSKVRLS